MAKRFPQVATAPNNNVDIPPRVAHAKSDEFPAGSINGIWTEFDPGSNQTGSIVSGLTSGKTFLELSQTYAANVHLTGYTQAVPAGSDYQIATKVLTHASDWNTINTRLGGLMLLDGVTASDKIHEAEIISSSDQLRMAERATHVSGTATATSNVGQWSYVPAVSEYFIRIRVSGTTVSDDFSWDGEKWITQVSQVSNLGSGISHFAPFISNGASGTTATLRFEWVRVWDNSNFSQEVGGGL